MATNHPNGVYMDVTSVNTIVTLYAPPVITTPVRLQNFSADTAVDVNDFTMAEVRMGIDGGLAAGYVPSTKELTITLEAASPSRSYLEALYMWMETNQQTVNVIITVDQPTLRKRYIFETGVLQNGTVMSSVQKTLKAIAWKFIVGKVTIENY